MSLQVGASCYASAADAGRAACSQFSPMLHVGETTARTISCTSADATSGALNLKIVSTDLASSAVTVTTTQQLQDYPPCVIQDYVDSLEVVAAAVLAVWSIWYCGMKLVGFLGWSRGDSNV
jgi:hypothetical protein